MNKIEALQKKFAKCKAQNVALSAKINRLTFTEFVKVHTGLPNAKVVKVVFEHVSKTLPSDGAMKLFVVF